MRRVQKVMRWLFILLMGGILLSVPPISQPQRQLAPEEVWKILYPDGISEKVAEAVLLQSVHPAIWHGLQSWRNGKLDITKIKKPDREGEIYAYRCFLTEAELTHAHDIYYWGGALPLPDSLEVIYQAPYTLWKVKGMRNSPQPVEFDEKGNVTSAGAQKGDYFLKSRTGPNGMVEHMFGCVTEDMKGRKSVIGHFSFPILEPERQVILYDGSRPASWDDFLRFVYWDAIQRQVVFAAIIFFYETDSLPKSRADLTYAAGEEIPEHWTPPVVAFVNHLLQRME